jgi:hypothetical protein
MTERLKQKKGRFPKTGNDKLETKNWKLVEHRIPELPQPPLFQT